ncbi:biopolymer transporter ExbD [Maritimibacter sp. DP1N21-5]|uniref:ExbD/TolR family protein n=1 Tax=Maritimibacter sp. DP1N21-5 TaxID=2836867 RepID=UPI001C477570|nr:biopolymer transporter ExbD [Maritimibacter sp. DP1N21-5]MBV7407696.1 biopolymer transporter ExbD [Maritimibacter sp. DP1N21-5]
MTALALPRTRRSRKPSLTPMIDVVFLLLVFFMLASRFGGENAIQLAGGTAGETTYAGPPRLVDVLPQGVLLNGSDIREETLAAQLETLTAEPSDTIVIRAREGADVQRLVAVIEVLSDAGYTGLVMVD